MTPQIFLDLLCVVRRQGSEAEARDSIGQRRQVFGEINKPAGDHLTGCARAARPLPFQSAAPRHCISVRAQWRGR
jgi:hypothetical protein